MNAIGVCMKANISTIDGSTQIRSCGQTSWPLTLAEAAKSHKKHPVLIPAMTLFSYSDTVTELSSSTAACPSLSLPFLHSGCHTGGDADKLGRAAMTQGGGGREGRRKRRDNLCTSTRTCGGWEERFIEKGELEDNEREGKKWCSRLFLWWQCGKNGSVGFEKTKRRRDKDSKS